MIYNYSNYLFLILLILIVFIILDYSFFKKNNVFLNRYWQLKPTVKKKVSKVIYYTALTIMGLTLMDIRGEIKKIDVKKQTNNTIILLDTSLSMASEDISPNRLGRAIFLARHLIKKLTNSQISVLVFSDNFKILTPFTKDIDFLNTKLKSLNEINIINGGSNIARAIEVSQKYLDRFDSPGNIVIFSDGESHSKNGILKKIKANVFFVGMGSFQGSVIPVRNDQGDLMYNKSTGGKEIISKLNEDFLKSLGQKLTNYKYFIPLNLGLPTNEIANDINKNVFLMNKNTQRNLRPVIGIYFLLTALILLSFSQFLDLKNTYKYGVLAILASTLVSPVNATRIRKDFHNEIQTLKNGNYDYNFLLKFANKNIKEKSFQNAFALYDETIHLKPSFKENKKFNNNLGLLLVKMKHYNAGLSSLILAATNNESKSIINIYNNILLVIEKDNNQSKKSSKNKKSKKRKNKKGASQRSSSDNKKNKKEETKNNKSKSIADKKKEKLNEITKLIQSMDKEMQKKYLKTSKPARRSGVKYDW